MRHKRLILLLDDGIVCDWCRNSCPMLTATPRGCVACFAYRHEFHRAALRPEWPGFWRSIYVAKDYTPHAVFADWLEESGFPGLSETMRLVVEKYGSEFEQLTKGVKK